MELLDDMRRRDADGRHEEHCFLLDDHVDEFVEFTYRSSGGRGSGLNGMLTLRVVIVGLAGAATYLNDGKVDTEGRVGVI
jgi:hypothetical protein